MNPFKRDPLSNLGRGAVTTNRGIHHWQIEADGSLTPTKGSVMTHNGGEQGTSATEPVSGDVAYTGVIRGAEPPETREDRYISAMWACDEDFMAAVGEVMVLADAEHAALAAQATSLWHERETLISEVERLRRVISTVLDTTDAHLGAKDAIIERLWRQLDEATNVPLVMHEPGCSLDTDHKGSCVLGERISGVDECPCSRCAHYRDVAASIAAKATP